MRLGRQRQECEYQAIMHFYKEENWSVTWMCRQLGISRSSYYKWVHRDMPAEERENRQIAEWIREYGERYGHILGYRRITLWINRFKGTHYNSKRIHRIMKAIGESSGIRRKGKKCRARPAYVAENRLGRDFRARRPNEKWVTDVTEFPIPFSRKKLYLSTVLDLYDRTPVSYILSNSNDNQLVFDTFDQAIRAHPRAAPLLHTDRGVQYTSREFQMKLADHGIEHSMSRPSRCIDNGPMEGFWGILKTEMYCLYEITDEKSLRNAIRDYLIFYRRGRPQERFGGKTPAEVRAEALRAAKPSPYPIAVNRKIQKFKEKCKIAETCAA